MPTVMTNFEIGLGWDTKLDVDCSVILMDANGKMLENIFYGNKSS